MIKSIVQPLFEKFTTLLHQKEGKFTSELLRSPGDFGLGQVPTKLKPDSTTDMVCGFCSTGCSLKVHLKDNKAINLSPNINYPVNLGMACPKGWEALSPLTSPDRATKVKIKNSAGEQVDATWQEGLQHFVENIKKVQDKHGKESVAFISTGQIATEEMAYLGALTKFGMGMLHGDGNTRQCMATAVVSYKQSFGFDAPPYTYKDFEDSDVIVLVGSNLCIAHPIMWERVCKNPNSPEIVVVDPRKTETAMSATQHLMLKPKSDLILFYGLANLLIEKGWIDNSYIKEHTNDFEAFKDHVKDYNLDFVHDETGITRPQMLHLAKTIHEGKRVSFWWTMGVNQSYEGVRVAQSLINLALMTGNIGKPGTGANSITGQCNAMGSRLFSNTTNLFGGHDFKNADHRQKIADLLGIDVKHIPTKDSLAYDQIIEGVESGTIKALWVIGTNGSHSWIERNRLQKALDNLEYLVVQDMYDQTESAKSADLILPASGWGEKFGTFINSERRVGIIKKVSVPPGESLADFYIFKLIAKAWGCEHLFKNWNTPEDVFKFLTQASEGQPCDISGITGYQMIDTHGGIQWPLKSTEAPLEQERRLFADGTFYHANGRAKFCFEAPLEKPELPTEDFPFTLMTGRGTSAQWHTQTRTENSTVLKKLYPTDIYVEVNSVTAEKMGIQSQEWVEVSSPRGTIKAQAFVTPTVKRDHLFIPMHYKEVNDLTLSNFDKYSRQPSYKYCTAQIKKIN